MSAQGIYALDCLPPEARATVLTIREQKLAIINACARRHDTDLKSVLGPARFPNIIRARWEAMALVRARFGDSYPKIGQIFHKDHTSAIHGIAAYLGFKRHADAGLGGACAFINDALVIQGEDLRVRADSIIHDSATRRQVLISQVVEHRHVQA